MSDENTPVEVDLIPFASPPSDFDLGEFQAYVTQAIARAWHMPPPDDFLTDYLQWKRRQTAVVLLSELPTRS